MTGAAHIIRADARHLPLPDESVDLICTSPPYFSLRSYQDSGEHYDGQVGSEATPAEFVDALIECTREWVRVLKPSGSLWVNLGDKYATTLHSYNYRDPGTYTRKTPQPNGDWSHEGWDGVHRANPTACSPGTAQPKSLMGLPWRYALRCVDDLGLILRAEVVWAKPNGLPESVTDRVRRSHEQWFHLVRQPRYYTAVDEIREPASDYTRPQNYDRGKRDGSRGRSFTDAVNPLGKLPGSVWEIPSEPLRVPEHVGVDHFAAFPTEWPRRIIAGWSPSGICVACDQGRRPVATPEGESYYYAAAKTGRDDVPLYEKAPGAGGNTRTANGTVPSFPVRQRIIIGYVCGCDQPTAPTRPSVILDPFGGTGTVSLVAKALGRVGVSVDLSADYCRLARWRTQDPDQLAHAMRVPKPPKQVDGQLGLDLGEAS